MSKFRLNLALSFAVGAGFALAAAPAVHGQAPAPAAAPPRQLGTVKSIEGSTLTVVTKDGPVTVTLAADAAVLQLAPGSTDLKTAQPAKLTDVSVGDKVLTGKAGDTATASRIILMKSGDIAARNQAEQADWQKRGSSGLVKAVDGDTLTVTEGVRIVKVTTTPRTLFRRYAADSVKFQDATSGSLSQVHTGDQVSVRGDKSEDGMTITAEEIVTGSFANLSGVLTAVDPIGGTISLKDLTTKKAVMVKLTANADIRKLPPQAAAMFASRNNPSAAGNAAGSPGARPAGAASASNAGPGMGAPAAAGGPGGGPGSGRARAGMDLSRMLARLPTQTVADLKIGDAVMIVASPSSSGDAYTAITLLSGVEPLLSAAPGAQPITLSPWNLGAPEGGGGGPQ